MQVPKDLSYTTIEPTQSSLDVFVQMLRNLWRQMAQAINGGITLGDGSTSTDNMNAAWLNTTSPVAPNTDFTLTHNLGRIPAGYLVMEKNQACDIYTGSVAPTKTQVTLRATAGSTTLRIFIISLLLTLLTVGIASAQTTNVTITVTDANSQVWSSGTWQAKLVTPPGVVPYGPPFYLLNTTTPVPNQLQSGTLSNTAQATMTLTQNAGIAPALSQWQFTVCAQATNQNGCYTTLSPITPSSTSLAITPPGIIVQPGQNNTVYTTNEVNNPVMGSQIYVIGAGLETYDGSTWYLGGPGTATVVAVQKEGYTYAADTGTTNAYAVALSPSPGSYTTGLDVAFKATNASTGASTLNVNGLGAKTIKKFVTNVLYDIAANDIGAGQIIRVKYDGTYFQIVGGAGGGGTPGGVQGDIQMNSSGSFGAAPMNYNGSYVKETADTSFQGPNPYIDIRNYGASSGAPNTTGSITSGTNTVTVASSSGYAIGNGVTIVGAGATNTLATPAAPAVVSVNATGSMDNGIVASGTSGATTYQYCVRARTKDGGFTPCSTATVLATGATTLGAMQVSISSISQTTYIATVTTSAAHNLTVGSVASINGTSSSAWNGDWTVQTVPSGTTFTIFTGRDTRQGQLTAQGAAGTVSLYQGNRIQWTAVANAWQYYIYGRTAGAMNLICISDPENNNITQNPRLHTCEDWGATISGAPSAPFYAPTTATGSITNGNLTTTITNIVGNTITLTANAGNTVSGSSFLLDNAPNIASAASAAISANAPMYIPCNAGFTTRSVLSISAFNSQLNVIQCGNLNATETIQLLGNTNWIGARSGFAGTCPSFSFACHPVVYTGGIPGFWIQQTVNMTGITAIGNTNQAVLFLEDATAQIPASSFKDVMFNTYNGNGSPDYLGQGFVARTQNTSGSGGTNSHWSFVDCSFVSGPDQVSNTTRAPFISFLYSIAPFVEMRHTFFNRRGAFFYGGVILTVDSIYREGGITPMFTVSSSPDGNSANLTVEHIIQDTEAEPIVLNTGTVGGILRLYESNGPQPGTPQIVQNANPNNGDSWASFMAVTTTTAPINMGQNIGVAQQIGSTLSDGLGTTLSSYNMGIEKRSMSIGLAPISDVFVDTLPISVNCSVSAGGSVALGTYTFEIGPVFPVGTSGNGEGTLSSSSPTCTTTTGNQTITVTWTAVAGAIGYDVYRSSGASFFSFQCSPPYITPGTTTTFIWTNQTLCGQGAPAISGSGPTSVTQTAVTSQALQMEGNGYKTTITAPSATANQSVAIPNATGSVLLDSTITAAFPWFNPLSVVFDQFHRPNGSLGSTWTQSWTNNGSVVIVSNAVTGNNAGPGLAMAAVYNTSTYTFPANQWAEIQFTNTIPASGWEGVVLRGTGPFQTTGYACLETGSSNNAIWLAKLPGFSLPASGSNTPAVGDILIGSVYTSGVNAVISCTVIHPDGTITTPIQLYTDSSSVIASGQPGIIVGDNVIAATNWIAGTMNAPVMPTLSSIPMKGVAGNSGFFAQSKGALTNAHLASFDSNANVVDSGIATTSVTQLIGSGTSATPTAAIAASACGSATTVTVTGALTTDNITLTPNADPSGTTGFLPGAMLTIVPAAGSGNFTYKLCNNTGSSITPTSITLNYRVIR